MASSRIHRLLNALQRLALPIVTAESCTSGLLASALTSRATAPSILLGGVTSYSALFKSKILGVPEEVLNTEKGGPGDVSRECAEAMARGVLKHSGLLDPSDERAFKFGVLLERGQGV
jgi:nicotinamide-nucleotide amidase